MSSTFEDSVTYTYVSNAAHGLSDTNAESSLAAKSGCFFIEGTGAEIDTAITSNAGWCYFAWADVNSVIHRSPKFRGTSITNAVSADTAAKTEQVSFLGSNGTTGSLDTTLKYYGVGIVLNYTFGLLNNTPLIKTVPYKLTTASQSTLAIGIADAGVAAWNREPHRDVVFEAVCDTAASATNDFDNNVTVVNGSKNVTVTSNLQYNGGAGTAVAGDFIRFADDTLNGTLDARDPVYRIEEVNSLTLTLDRPVTVASGAWTDAGDGNQVIPAATAAGDNWGVKMTGSTPVSTFNAVTDSPFVVEFDVEADDFSTAEVSVYTKPYLGVGTAQLVQFDEAYALFHERDRYVAAYPPKPDYTFQAAYGSGYNVIEFEASEQEFSSATTGISPKSKFRIKIYLLDSTCDTDYSNFKTVVGATAITTTAPS